MSAARRASRGGLTFLEILIGATILVLGLVPLFLAYSASTRGTRVSIQQVQAVNHSANLLEALRAFAAVDFKNISYFPGSMEQRKGGDQEWMPPSEQDEPGAEGTTRPPVLGGMGTESPAGARDVEQIAQNNFREFKRIFFSGKQPVVAPLEKVFRRSFRVSQRSPGLVTVIVKVSWEEFDLQSTQGAGERVVELRTVLGDPYVFVESSRGGSRGREDGEGAGRPGGDDAARGREERPGGAQDDTEPRDRVERGPEARREGADAPP